VPPQYISGIFKNITFSAAKDGTLSNEDSKKRKPKMIKALFFIIVSP